MRPETPNRDGSVGDETSGNEDRLHLPGLWLTETVMEFLSCVARQQRIRNASFLEAETGRKDKL